jgi:aryl-alcohol dehydrogenase-like predicted oxidoreductase
VVGLGTWQRLEAAAASGQHRERIEAAIAASIRLIDTSPMYGDAERLLADAFGATACRATRKPTSADQAQHPRRLLNS